MIFDDLPYDVLFLFFETVQTDRFTLAALAFTSTTTYKVFLSHATQFLSVLAKSEIDSNYKRACVVTTKQVGIRRHDKGQRLQFLRAILRVHALVCGFAFWMRIAVRQKAIRTTLYAAEFLEDLNEPFRDDSPLSNYSLWIKAVYYFAMRGFDSHSKGYPQYGPERPKKHVRSALSLILSTELLSTSLYLKRKHMLSAKEHKLIASTFLEPGKWIWAGGVVGVWDGYPDVLPPRHKRLEARTDDIHAIMDEFTSTYPRMVEE